MITVCYFMNTTPEEETNVYFNFEETCCDVRDGPHFQLNF